MASECRVCGAPDLGSAITARETMFGTGETFVYRQCRVCGCLQIVEPPERMDRFYQPTYYSFGSGPSSPVRKIKTITRAVLALYGPAWLFSRQQWWTGGAMRAVRDGRITRADRILDLGCGSGEFIANLGDVGYRRVLGADPFIDEDIIHPNGVRVLKRAAHEIDDIFDVLMMHHSLEHVGDQKRIVIDVARLLAPEGRCVIRIPTIDSWAWGEYGLDWAQLDAPRHFFLHTRASIRTLLESAGLRVTAIIDDSTSFQILGSEKIRRGYPLIDASQGKPLFAEFLPPSLIRSAARRARVLNAAGRGDSIAVHARKVA